MYQALVAVAEYYGIEVMDLTHNSVVNRLSLPSLLDDGAILSWELKLLAESGMRR